MTRIVSFSELDTARQCPLKHELAYVGRWSRPHSPDSALSKGTAWHTVMEAHYTTLMRAQKSGLRARGEEAVRLACVDAVSRVIEPMDESLQGLMWWMYQGYAGLYGLDPEWEILAVEHAAECRLPTLTGGRSTFILKMKIDLVVRNRRTRHIIVVDHKSGKDLPGKKLLELDDQFGLYTWGMRQLGRKVFGQVYNAARTYRLQADVAEPGATPLDERFRRVPLHRSDRELDIVATEAYQTALARYQQQRSVERAGAMSPRHTNPETCQWRCDFKEACLAGRKGISIRGFLQDTGFTQQFERH